MCPCQRERDYETETFVLDDPPVDLTHNRDNILLDKVTGRLAMEKMTKDDEGVYSVEINNKV
ncbi:hypothetical protein F7725_023716 [Dissostichus mawsoni]|uniref:Uncharacterized protein n=1 Tax=Dissostichus mawsoni TaxID=36200 RepID=A0A7J5XXC8_DISMA|nr:hypothetical protein F7725_023716 [Dissostichus mawsoni]